MTGYDGSSRERLALRTYFKLVRAANAVGARLNRPLADAGLSESQFGVLQALLNLGPLHQHELAAKILRTHGNVTLVVDHLEKRKLVRRERGSTDRRYVRVHLTHEGESLVRGIFPAHAARLADEMGALDEAAQRKLGQLCRRLLRQSTGLAAGVEVPMAQHEAEDE